MREFKFPLSQYMDRGLAPSNNPRNNPMLTESIGALVYKGTLEATEEFSRIDTSGLGAVSFPYPQFFVASNTLIVCTESAIYETLDGTSLTSKITGLAVGSTWCMADYKTYLIFMNGATAVQKVHDTGAYEEVTYNADGIPYGFCICDYNGQALIGSPETS